MAYALTRAVLVIQSKCSKVYFNEMQGLAASLQVDFAISGKEPFLKEHLQILLASCNDGL